MVVTSKDPNVQVTVGVIVPSTLSVAVRVDINVPPEGIAGENALDGVKVTTGDVVSGGAVMETISAAVPSFPAASRAVAVHVAVVSTLTTGAV